MRPVPLTCPMSSMGRVPLESTTALTPLMKAMESTTVRLEAPKDFGKLMS
jgi:hypothetical protein